MGWDGNERRAMHRRAHKSLTCIDQALKTDQPASRAVLESLRMFILEQWLPHLEFIDQKATQLDKMHAIFLRLEIWMNGACWVLHKGLPGLLIVGGAVIGAGKLGAHLGLW